MSGRSTGSVVEEPFRRTELDRGLVVLTEEMPWVRSASMGVCVRHGAAHESLEQAGVSHLLEHMVFKGTRERSAREIALTLERLGGGLDAYTTREHTSFQARVLDEHVDIGLDVLADLVLDPLLRESDLDLERGVVLEEIATVEDTPDDLVFELHGDALWGDHPYGRSILGTRESVAALTAGDLRQVHHRSYGLPNLLVAVAGNIEHDAVVERVAGLFGRAPDGGAQGRGIPDPAPNPPGEHHVTRDTAQSHMVFGTTVFGHGDPRRYALVLLSSAFGGGMSSRLFQRVREELGLAYTVFSFNSFYSNAGLSGIYAGVRPDLADVAAEAIREELGRVARFGLTEDELDDVKGQVKGRIVLSLDSGNARLTRLVGTALYDEPFLTEDELIARVDAVTLEDVAALAAEYFDADRQVELRLGPAA